MESASLSASGMVSLYSVVTSNSGMVLQTEESTERTAWRWERGREEALRERKRDTWGRSVEETRTPEGRPKETESCLLCDGVFSRTFEVCNNTHMPLRQRSQRYKN